MIRRLICILTALFCVSFALFACADAPEWAYPLAPEILADNTGYITLTNKSALLDADYEPDDLVVITVRCVSSIRGDKLRKDANAALQKMFDDAEAEGMKLYAKSVYRSYTTQNTMYRNRLSKVGRDDGVVAYPGSSDHQTGLGVDILNYEWTKKEGMNAAFGQTAEAKWMAEHCAEYGFIIRYMEDKEDVTGIIYEPWHLRFVGKDAARYIMDSHLALEEFDAEWRKYLLDFEAAGGDFKQLLFERAQPNPVIVLETTEDGEEEVSLFYKKDGEPAR